MSVASANPFAILNEESSPPGSPGPATKKKEASASQTTHAPPKSKGPASRGGRYYPRGGKTPRESTQDGQEEAAVGDESASKKDGEGRGRGRGRGRGDRGRGRGRSFDRHSGTGKTDSDKKIHQGWGGDEGGTELKAEEAGKTDAQAEGAAAATDGWDAVPIDPWSAPPSADPWGAPPEGDSTTAPEGEKAENDRKPAERELEDEESTISYDQYVAQLKETTTASIPKLEGIREVNEGDDGAWADVADVVERKKNEDEQAYFVGKTKATNKVRAEKKEKVFLEIDARFDRPNRGGRGRGDRGRGRDRGDRGDRGARGRRGTNGTQPTVNVEDENAFPSLS